jgi:hypothetical protein
MDVTAFRTGMLARINPVPGFQAGNAGGSISLFADNNTPAQSYLSFDHRLENHNKKR